MSSIPKIPFKSIFLISLLLIIGIEANLLFDRKTEEEDIKIFIQGLKECHKDENYNKCLSENSHELVSRYSLPEINQAYEEITGDLGVNYTCHDIMHHIASDFYEKNNNMADLFKQCSSVCFNACYHGVVLGFMEHEDLYSLPQDQMRSILSDQCTVLQGEDEVFEGECIHGLGHALMLVSNNDLPASLSYCDNIDQPYLCHAGVFMENFPGTSTSDHPSKYFKKGDYNYPCNDLDLQYKSQCYLFSSGQMIMEKGKGFTQNADECSLIDEEYRDQCYRFVGTIVQNYTHDPTEMFGTCKSITDFEGRLACVKGIVSSFPDRFGGIKDRYLKMFDFCNSLGSTYSKGCYQEIAESLRRWVPDTEERNEICKNRTINEIQAEWCRGMN